ncbi:MAG: S1 RNA-binding domain-containing protein [Pseudoflavonifractor sp.]
MLHSFLPEGRRLMTRENQLACASEDGLLRAMGAGQILEGTVLLCDEFHNLMVSLGGFTGRIPREETALGIAEGSTREIAILSRVGKAICFTVEGLEYEDGLLRPRLSRRNAQARALKHCMETLRPGDILPATVTHLEPFGTFVDIGCGLPSMIGIENSSVSRIAHPSERFFLGQEIFAAVLGVRPDLGRITLSHKELLGTWPENVAQFTPGMTVAGYVRGIKEYGAFVELAPNLSGLAELRGDLREGDRVSVYIKAILPERMKIKLLVIDRLPKLDFPAPFRYFLKEGRLDAWRYAPPGCEKCGAETLFL